LEITNPVITVNNEFAKLLVENMVEICATNKLIIKPKVPESSKFLLREIILLYFIKYFSNVFIILICHSLYIIGAKNYL
jgi:hypothetical protein